MRSFLFYLVFLQLLIKKHLYKNNGSMTPYGHGVTGIINVGLTVGFMF